MKPITLLSTLFIAAGISFGTRASAQTAELQVIHNSADPAAGTVDIYVNGAITLDDFAFRTATPFLTVPAGVTLNIGVAPGNSSSAADTLKNFEVVLTSGERYVAIANGVLDPMMFAANPDARSTAFTLFLQDSVRNMAANMGDVDFFALHGSSDAPTVDITARNVATLVDDAAYGDITGYLSVPPSSYILDVTPGAGSPIVASFLADLSGLADSSAVVFASGFLTPSSNQNGPAFGLFAALANGVVVEFPATSQARLQIIHNAADPAAATVDIYVNGTMILDDFNFREATPYISVPADSLLNIGVAAGNSMNVGDTLKNFEVTLMNGNSYVAIANGVLDPMMFAANPDAIPTAFTLFLQDSMKEASMNTGEVDFRVVHGASDAPTVDVIARNVSTLVDDAAYAAITPYLNVPPASYILDVTPAAGSPIVASFLADLSGLADSSAVVFASGFLTPSSNQNGPAFGLFAALANGVVVEFPATSQARLQIIHNAADPAAATVDIYVNGTMLLDDFNFREATPYISVPADSLLNIGVAAGNSMNVGDTLKNFEVTLMNGNSYVAIANGVLDPMMFAANPDAIPTAFTLFLQDSMRESSMNPGEVDFRVVHGASDAPTVDVLTGTTTLVDDAPYAAITPYLNVPPASYIVDITPGNNNSTIVASYDVDVTALAGGSAVLIASGFLDPVANQNGPAFTLIGVLADGTVVLFNNVTGIDENDKNQFGLFPNPASETVYINFAENTSSDVILTICNSVGAEVINERIPAGSTNYTINTSGLSKGLYVINTITQNSSVSRKLVIQ